MRLTALVLALGAMAVAAATQVSRLSEIEWAFSPAWLAVGILAFSALQLPTSDLWISLVRRLGAELPTGRGRTIWCVSLLGRYLPTGALMVVGRVDMARRAGVPRRVCLSSIVYEMALTLGAAALICAGFVFVLRDVAPGPVRWAAPAVGVAAIAALHPRILRPVVDRLLARAGAESLPSVLSAREVGAYMFAYVGYFLIAGLGTLALALAMHPVEPADAPLVMASFAIGFIASLVGFLSPGGLGAREIAQATALTAAMPFAVGLAVAIVTRLVQMGVELAFAGLTPLLEARRH